MILFNIWSTPQISAISVQYTQNMKCSFAQLILWWVEMVMLQVSVLLCAGDLNELVQHGLRALRETLPAEQDLTTKVWYFILSLHSRSLPLLPHLTNVWFPPECVHWDCGKGNGVHHLWRWRCGKVPGGSGGETPEKGEDCYVCLQVCEDVCDLDLMVFVDRRWPSQQMKRLQLYLMNPWRPNMYFCTSVGVT